MAKLADFGLSTLLDKNRAMVHIDTNALKMAVVGTPLYCKCPVATGWSFYLYLQSRMPINAFALPTLARLLLPRRCPRSADERALQV